ncbi:undecaprenyl pyrophosphate synthetase [Niallia circulans]|nr:hypothetical protein CHH59_16970 [Shouchella clausii]SPT78475.1 undecaprenyl pyrophosphate synthetase [Niallia circulans]
MGLILAVKTLSRRVPENRFYFFQGHSCRAYVKRFYVFLVATIEKQICFLNRSVYRLTSGKIKLYDERIVNVPRERIIINFINHIAIIPDGNRRWAKKKGLLSEGSLYDKGAANFQFITEALFSKGVNYVTFWVSSVDNLKNREKSLVKAMHKLYAKKFTELLNDSKIMENKIKVQVCGSWRTFLEKDTIDMIEQLLVKTANNDKGILTLLVAYDGKIERGQAVISLLDDHVLEKNINKDPLTFNSLLKKHSWTGYLPSVDFIIRTGSWNDPHNSADFLSFLTGDSQLYFPEVYWPDFDSNWLEKSLQEYTSRERRKGS